MKRKIIDWLRDKLGITRLEEKHEDLKNANNFLRRVVEKKFDDLDELTRIDADISNRGQCTVILTGVYRGKAYVQYYDIPTQEFVHLVEEMRQRRKYNLIRNIDHLPSFRGAFDLNLKGAKL